MSNTITLPRRRVTKTVDGWFVVEQADADNIGGWSGVSKSYQHSTSAFAALGRLVQKDTQAAA